MSFFADKLLPARTVRIHNLSRVELDVELPFGAHLHRTFTVTDMQKVPEALRTRATHALVVLIGGKRMLIQPEHTREDARSARLFLNERVHGTPIGIVQHVERLVRPILDVAMFMSWLADRDFDIRIVREVVNGNRVSVETEG